MTALYFVIAALAAIGAAVLLWLDRRRIAVIRRERAVWGDCHGFRYVASEADAGDDVPHVRELAHRATMDTPADVEIRDITHGRYYGEVAVVFDLVDVATIVMVRRSSESPVVIDLRQEKVLAPAEEDVELLGAMGRRVMFSTHLDIARRVCDRRMVALATNAPDYIEVMWNEGHWSVASMPLTNDPERLDTALETVRRFTDLLRVLPPASEPGPRPDPRDPSAPSGRGRRGFAEPKTESITRDELAASRENAPRPTPRPAGPDSGPRRMDQDGAPRRADLDGAPRRVDPDGAPRRGVQPMPVRRRVERLPDDVDRPRGE
ncbi:type III secretion system chaperone family protein [Williamsia deligens]|uniref:Secreted protein n=1 Tax=Williamsia deligens TaxID=321325 RepID=A0ABW3G2W2_9NOCA|nr:hypothetical protein [Williamsia deligens]MCP2194254.1 hypothetical protein [Williamsia deligens]